MGYRRAVPTSDTFVSGVKRDDTFIMYANFEKVKRLRKNAEYRKNVSPFDLSDGKFLFISLPPGGRWHAKRDGRSLR